jgi:integrase
MVKPTTKKASGKVGKPRADFPLFVHARGYWAKKVRGKLYYFGKVADDPKGMAALDKWLAVKDARLAGREPHPERPAGATVRDLANAFLTHKRNLLHAGELTDRTFAEYFATCERLVKVLGKDRPVDDLLADDFDKLRAQIARSWGPIRLANEIQRTRSIFRYGWESGLIEKEVRFGPGFKKPSAKVLRKNRAKRGLRMFEREELLTALQHATPTMHAMLLLGVNCGFGNTDIATLPAKAVNLSSGWVDFPRPKTGVGRRVPLWPETVAAIKAYLTQRRKPHNADHDYLLFIGGHGKAYDDNGHGYRVAAEMVRLLAKAKMQRPGLSFYSLRHGFQTVAEGARDLSAVQAIMGHVASGSDMSARYRERVDDARLVAVVQHVHKWLFGENETK